MSIKNNNESSAKTALRRWQIACIVFALAVIGVSIYAFVLWDHSGGHLEEQRLQYSRIDPARNIIPQEHYILTLQPLRNTLNTLVERESEQGIEVTLYLEYLNTGGNIAINQETRLIPASLNKLPIAMAVMKKIENGEWRLDDKLVLLPADRNSDYGTLYNEPPGTPYSIEFLLEKLLKESDNTAFAILYRNLEIDEPQRLMHELGLAELFDNSGQITAKEYSRLFRALYTASYLNRDNSQLVLTWLEESMFKDFLSQGFPAEVPFSRKFGLHVENRVFAESGVAYVPNRPYLITVIVHPQEDATEDEDLENAQRIMKEISSAVYTYVSSL